MKEVRFFTNLSKLSTRGAVLFVEKFYFLMYKAPLGASLLNGDEK